MNVSGLLSRLAQQETVNFLLTNRIPRRTLTRLIAWYSQLESPWIVGPSMRAWQMFGGQLDLHDAKRDTFVSLQDCFTRELRDGARPIDCRPEVLISPCDAIVGQCGRIVDQQLLQAKRIAYPLDQLVLDPSLAAVHRDGVFATLRL